MTLSLKFYFSSPVFNVKPPQKCLSGNILKKKKQGRIYDAYIWFGFFI